VEVLLGVVYSLPGVVEVPSAGGSLSDVVETSPEDVEVGFCAVEVRLCAFDLATTS